jgi:peptidoglycan hydrolase CwlO-like protein
MNENRPLLPTNAHYTALNDNNSKAHSSKLLCYFAGGVYIALLTTGTVAAIAAIPTSIIATWLTAAGYGHLVPYLPIFHEAAHFLATVGFGGTLISDTLIATAAATLRTIQGFCNPGDSRTCSRSKGFKRHFKEAKHDINQTISQMDYDKLHDQLDDLLKEQNKQKPIIASNVETIKSLQQQIDNLEETVESHKKTIDSHKKTIDSHKKTIDSHKKTIDIHKGTIAKHEEAIDTQQSHINSHKKTITEHEEAIDTQQSHINSHEKTITEHEEAIDTQGSQIDRLEATIDRQKIKLMEHDECIADLKKTLQSMLDLQHDNIF